MPNTFDIEIPDHFASPGDTPVASFETAPPAAAEQPAAAAEKKSKQRKPRKKKSTEPTPTDTAAAAADTPPPADAAATTVPTGGAVPEPAAPADPPSADQPVPDPPPPQPAAPKTKKVNQESARRWYEQRKASLEHDIANLLREELRLTTTIKEIKQEKKDLVKELDKHIERGPQAMPLVVDEDDVDVDGDDGDESDAWRDTSLNELQLKKGTHKLLIEAEIQTIGDLQDLRAKIADGKGSWPKWVGTEKVTEIEDVADDWLAKNVYGLLIAQEVQQGQEQAQQAQSAETAPSATETPTAETSSAAAVPDSDNSWGNLTDAQRMDQLAERANILNTGKKNSLDSKHAAGDKFWKEGYGAAELGWDMVDCDHPPGDEQDDWLRGYLAYETVESFEESKAPAESSTQDELAISADDL